MRGGFELRTPCAEANGYLHYTTAIDNGVLFGIRVVQNVTFFSLMVGLFSIVYLWYKYHPDFFSEFSEVIFIEF